MIFFKNYQFLNKFSNIDFSSYWLNSYKSSIEKNNFFFLSHQNNNTLVNYNITNTNIYNIYFLRKESFYTKLKYSRVPQFDTASGAVASLLSGFYGFLVCEKFGFELIDSADFLFLALYVILLSFIITTVLKVIEGYYNINLFVSYWFRSFW